MGRSSISHMHRVRRLALQGLCCVDAQGNTAWEQIEQFIRDSHDSEMIVNGSMGMLRSVFDARPMCDDLLKRHAKRWELSRLALVDRNILRMGAWELLQGETPFKVVISESLRLAREFSTAESPRFVNGVLDAIARDIQKELEG